MSKYSFLHLIRTLELQWRPQTNIHFCFLSGVWINIRFLDWTFCSFVYPSFLRVSRFFASRISVDYPMAYVPMISQWCNPYKFIQSAIQCDKACQKLLTKMPFASLMLCHRTPTKNMKTLLHTTASRFPNWQDFFHKSRWKTPHLTKIWIEVIHWDFHLLYFTPRIYIW